MRKLAVAMALASTALASPALARDDTWYVGAEGGVMIVEDLKLDIGAVNNAASVDHDYGWDVGGYVGYDFGPFRTEVEVSYRRAMADQIWSSRVDTDGDGFVIKEQYLALRMGPRPPQ